MASAPEGRDVMRPMCSHQRVAEGFARPLANVVHADVMDDWAARLAEATSSAFEAIESARPRPARAQVLATALEATRPRPARRMPRAEVGTPVLRIYDEIGVWGTTAAGFAAELGAVTGGQLELRINSPGGDVFEAITIYNLLRDHPAVVSVVVDGVAASAASVIAMAGDRVVMNRGSKLMIHDALTLTYGNESEHLATADLLARVSDTIAAVYADRAGGTVEHWRAAMRLESWYDADEAVAAGLADAMADDAELDPAAVAAALRDAFS